MENLQFGLLLALVGMTTVFVVLMLLILLSKYLILFINRFIPAEEEKTAQRPSDASKPIDAVDALVIAETVKMITGGKGKVTKVEKI
ncbi:MAG: oxaloacetate decarboxylase [Bacteroidales bacterium]|jgi:oxaloacetate decarboxylase gamma subunit|nr:oxaloacetate decarboxylase [Bacteroidales bacterium]MBO5880492.1 OadG family protein [Paraprevotella sp.]MBP5134895.1 OadG family protein [Paludibacteraceae bacterium]MBR6309741.1 OadG family protein [Paludibacteraceae bacterium]MDD6357940.1 OadG family protein [Bacteroidales bacterium]